MGESFLSLLLGVGECSFFLMGGFLIGLNWWLGMWLSR